MKSSFGFRSCSRNDPCRARVSLRLQAQHWHPSPHCGWALPRSADGHSGVWYRTARSSERERLPAQDFIEGMAKVDYQKCNLLFFHRRIFSLKIPTQQLFITSFLLLEKLLGWHGNIFPPWTSVSVPPVRSRGLRASLVSLFTLSCHYCPKPPSHRLLIKLHLASTGMQSSCSLANVFCTGTGDWAAVQEHPVNVKSNS